MSKIQLTDVQWMFIRPLLPPPARTGRPRADDRRTIEGILYVLITGCRWQDLPRAYGAPTTVWRRLKRWGEAGVWECIWRAALAALDRHGRLDWSIVFLDGSFVPAKKGGEQVGLTRKGKGTKWMLVTDGTGLPLGFHLDGANRTEVRLAEQTLDTIRVARPRGRPKQRPQTLVADRGYDTYASAEPSNNERELARKTWKIFRKHEVWDIVVFREGVRASYPDVWIFERTLGYEWSPTPCDYLGGRRSGTFITM
jgi:transposase